MRKLLGWMNRHRFWSVIISLPVLFGMICVLLLVGLILNTSPQQSQAAQLAAEKAACTLDSQTFLNTVNQWRKAAGVQPLQYSDQLQKAAQARVADMQQYQYYSHYNPSTGKQQGQVVFKYAPGASMADEVLDAPNNAQTAISDFRNSPEHYNALVDKQYNYLGFLAEYLPEQWAEYDNDGKLQLAAGHPVWECLVVGELADRITPPQTTKNAPSNPTSATRTSTETTSMQNCAMMNETMANNLTSTANTAWQMYEMQRNSPNSTGAYNLYVSSVSSLYNQYATSLLQYNCPNNLVKPILYLP